MPWLAVIRFAHNKSKANCTSVGVKLYAGDANTPQKKVKRNTFYIIRGFTFRLWIMRSEREVSIWLYRKSNEDSIL